MTTVDEGVIIAFFLVSVVAFAILISFTVIQWKAYVAKDEKWKRWMLENPDKAPVAASRWIPLMNRQQILDQGELLDTANPMT
jgi:hypothetical protein